MKAGVKCEGRIFVRCSKCGVKLRVWVWWGLAVTVGRMAVGSTIGVEIGVKAGVKVG